MNRLLTLVALVALSLTAVCGVAINEQSTVDNKQTKVLIKTTMDDITVALYNETPLHRDNFLKLVKEH